MPESHPPYSPEFRRQMVELVRAGRSPEDLVREFEPTAQSIGIWVAPHPRRVAGTRGEVQPQAHRAPDARGRAGRRQPPPWRPDHDGARQGRLSSAGPGVDRDFTATGPNQLWVADLTYTPTTAGFLYLAIALDAWSRKPDAERQSEIVGWSMANHRRTELVLDAMETAVGQRRPKDVIRHSDQANLAIYLSGGRQAMHRGRRAALDGLHG